MNNYLQSDIEKFQAEIDDNGFCVVKNLISPDVMSAIRQRIDAQARAEKQLGLTLDDQVQTEGDKNQWVNMLINKGEVFQKLIGHPAVHEIVRHVLGDNYLLSDFAATITWPGNKQMGLHRDQWWLPEPRMPDEPPQRGGDITRSNVSKGPPTKSLTPINPPAVCNVLWMVSDFTMENGATRLVPKSHLSGTNPEPWGEYDTVNAVGPAGSAVIFDGRTWHAADLNTSDHPRYGITTYFGGPQFRQMNNFTYGIRGDVEAKLTPELRTVLGYKPWGGYGATGDQNAESIQRGEDQVGILGD